MNQDLRIGDQVIFTEDAALGKIKKGQVGRIVEIRKSNGNTPYGVEVEGVVWYPIVTRFERLRVFPDLPEGVKIGDEVEMWDTGSVKSETYRITAVTSDGRFVDNFDGVWDHCRPIPKKIFQRFKSLGFLISDLESRGYERRGSLFYLKRSAKGYDTAYLLEKAGTRYNNEPNTYAEWLEEVEEA